MHTISQKKLRQFWMVHKDSEDQLRAWFRTARISRWNCFADVRSVYNHADCVGKLTVFNVSGNKYRLIVSIDYARQKIYVKHVLTHKEYDLGAWKSG